MSIEGNRLRVLEWMLSLIDMKKKSVIVGSCMGAIIGLLFFMEGTIVMGINN